MVTYQEKSLLHLTARNVLRYTREAAARGEEYHPIDGFAPLQCGLRVQLRYVEIPGGYAPLIRIKKAPNFFDDDAVAAAKEIAGGDVELVGSSDSVLEYQKKP